MKASFDGRQVFIGTKKHLTENGCIGAEFNDHFLQTVSDWETEAKTVIYVGEKKNDSGIGNVIGIIAVADVIRPEARSVVEYLQKNNIDVYMLTGDNARTAKSVGEFIGIPEQNILSQVLPADKKGMVEHLQSKVIVKDLNPFQRMIGTSPLRKPVVAMVGYEFLSLTF